MSIPKQPNYVVDGMRFLPRPFQRPGVPIWVAGRYGKAKPLRRAARFQGFFPVNLKHPDQLAEMIAELTALRREIGKDVTEGRARTRRTGARAARIRPGRPLGSPVS